MGNVGYTGFGQNINWKFETPLRGAYLSGELAGVLEPGIYGGLATAYVTGVGSRKVRILPAVAGDVRVGKVILADSSAPMMKIVCVTFTQSIEVEIPTPVISYRYLVLRYTWEDRADAYADFWAVQVPAPNDIIVCELLFTGSNLSGTADHARQQTPIGLATKLLGGFRVTVDKATANIWAVKIEKGLILTPTGLVEPATTRIQFAVPGPETLYYIVFDTVVKDIVAVTVNPLSNPQYVPIASVLVKPPESVITPVNRYIGESCITDLRWTCDARMHMIVKSLQDRITALEQRVEALE